MVHIIKLESFPISFDQAIELYRSKHNRHNPKPIVEDKMKKEYKQHPSQFTLHYITRIFEGS